MWKVVVQDLGKKYLDGQQEKLVFQGLNFAFQAGKIYAITGSSGAGKSTLFNLLAGLDLPSQGHVVVQEADRKLSGNAIQRINFWGMVFQEAHLLPELTARENIWLAATAKHGWSQAWQESLALCNAIGLIQEVDSYPNQLSGGQKQRVAVLRALAMQPKCLLADEPTGNLDQATGQRFIAWLLDLLRARQMGAIIFTHDPQLYQQVDEHLHLDNAGLNLYSID